MWTSSLRPLRWIALILAGFLASLEIAVLAPWPASAQAPLPHGLAQNLTDAALSEQRGRESYQRQEWALAIAAWQEARLAYQRQGDRTSQARVWNNLALAYQELGEWVEADRALEASFQLLAEIPASQGLPALAQAWNAQGILALNRGQPESALSSWERATQTYARAADELGVLRSQINQGIALQALGLHSRACKRLMEAMKLGAPTCEALVPEELDSALGGLPKGLDPVRGTGWRRLAEGLLTLGQVRESQAILEALLERLPAGEGKGAVLLSLGEVARARGDEPEALKLYQQAAEASQHPRIELEAQLARLDLLAGTQLGSEARELLPGIEAALERLPPSQTKIEAQINLARQLTRLKAPAPEVESLLRDALQQSQEFGYRRGEAYALGSLGGLYEQERQWEAAQGLTEKALLLAQAMGAPEVTYRWYWQLGRILMARGERQQGLAAYAGAIATLESIGGDLAANPEAQASFQENVEPVYREFASFLLEQDGQGKVSQDNLRQARDVMESLQVAELNNFFRAACLEAQPEAVEQIDRQAAVIYPFTLSDRLAVVLSLPQQPLRYYATPVSQAEVEATLGEFRYTLTIRSRRNFLAPAQKLYDWLVRPLEAELAASDVRTLVFVPEGPWRNVPLAALHDGKQYLIERYGVALTPSLQLLAPKPLQQKEFAVLLAGLTQPVRQLTALPYVSQELKAIQAQANGEILLDEEFTVRNLGDAIEFSGFPIVHIATHGQFSSKVEETFLVAWDRPIDIEQLDSLLQGRSPADSAAIELLVLSACQTAVGDRRAALGLAGMAVRSGARSTVATLWPVNDRATAELMARFYRQLASRQGSKAEALRQAQLALLKNRWYQHPFYWAPYILLGNWL